MSRLVASRVLDVRFPTSLDHDGSDAVNVDPDYSAAYLQLTTDADDSGYGLVFTCGRGNEVVVKAIESALTLLPDTEVEGWLDDLGGVSRTLVHDSQFRWIGPEKGVSHMAVGAVLTALWDLKARRAGLALWELIATLTPEEFVAAVDFSHVRDAITEDEALALLRQAEPGKAERIAELKATGYAAYTTSPGWLGYSDEKMVRLAKEAVADGFGLIKLKVGGSITDDVRRMRLAREAVGPDILIAIDANQKWEVHEAAAWIKAIGDDNIHWIEEPTSPDDVLGHARIRREVAPLKIATGEAVQNRIVVKQLLQAEAIDFLQIDSTRFAGPNENLANLLLAAKFGIPVCPHAGGVGLCELVVHFSFIDYAAVSGNRAGRVIEYVDHLHEHFTDPVVVERGHYRAPSRPGASAEMVEESVLRWRYPDGPGWVDLIAQGMFDPAPSVT